MSQTKNYIPLSKELEERIREDRENHVKNPYACSDDAVIRRDMAHDKQTICARHLSGIVKRSCISHITIVMRIKHRCFLCIKMMIFPDAHLMYSLYREQRVTLDRH